MRRLLRTYAIKSMLAALAASGLDRRLDGAARRSGSILTLHRVRPAKRGAFRPNAHLEITPGYLDLVLRRLAERRIPVVTLAEALERFRLGPAGGRYAVLTFDDGYRDNFVHALPVLERHDAPATIFVASGMVDGSADCWWMALEAAIAGSDELDASAVGLDRLDTRGAGRKQAAFDAVAERLWSLGEHARRLAIRRLAAAHGVRIPGLLAREMMNWSEVRRLAAHPLVTLGGHTHDHAALAQMTEADARAEILRGLDRIEAETGCRPTVFAYPYGFEAAAGPREAAIARDLGLALAVTTVPGLLEPEADPHALPRISLNGHFQSRSALDALLSGVPVKALEAGRRLMRPRRPRPVPSLPREARS